MGFFCKPAKYSVKVYDLNLGNFSKTGTSDEESNSVGR